MAVLMVVTSLAVASVSAWLVFPYLALMASILIAPPGRSGRGKGPDGESNAGSGLHAEGVDGRSGPLIDDEAVVRASADPAATVTELVVEPAERPALDSEPCAVKTQRGKGRGRKARAVAESPDATATWIQIGPGKFVRVETDSQAPQVEEMSSTSPSDGEPAGPLSTSHGTFEGPTDACLPPGRDDDADTFPVAGSSSAIEGVSEARAESAPGQTAADEPVPVHDEGDLGAGPEPDHAVGSAAAIDAALALPQHAPPYVTDPTDFFASLSGIGEGATGTPPPDTRIEAEAVVTAEESSPSGGGSGVEDEAAPGEPTADERASIGAGGDPGHASMLDSADGSAGVDVLDLESYPDALPPAGAEYGAGDGVEDEVEMARDAGDRALEEIVEASGVEVFPGAALGMDATSENDLDLVADVARDNGIAPDASVDIPPAEIAIEDAPSPRDRAEDINAPAAPVDRPNRPCVGKFLASLRGPRPWVRPATRWRSGPDTSIARRVVRSGRGPRVSPALRLPSRWAPGRSRTACRTFPPRSPPVLSRRP